MMGPGWAAELERALWHGLVVGAVLLVVVVLVVERLLMWVWSHLHISWS